MKIIFDSPNHKNELPTLLEGYLYGLGEVCHSAFGPKGEVAMYNAIGQYFLKYIKEKFKIEFNQKDPWERYCKIIETFTSFGFYGHVELDVLEDKKYWMLETEQYAGAVWEGQKAWERGTPPCPLWAVIIYSLSEIDQTIVLDDVTFIKESNGYESTFHFVSTSHKIEDVINNVKDTILGSLIISCSYCKKIKNSNGQWIQPTDFFTMKNVAVFSHGVCEGCYEQQRREIEKES